MQLLCFYLACYLRVKETEQPDAVWTRESMVFRGLLCAFGEMVSPVDVTWLDSTPHSGNCLAKTFIVATEKPWEILGIFFAMGKFTWLLYYT